MKRPAGCPALSDPKAKTQHNGVIDERVFIDGSIYSCQPLKTWDEACMHYRPPPPKPNTPTHIHPTPKCVRVFLLIFLLILHYNTNSVVIAMYFLRG